MKKIIYSLCFLVLLTGGLACEHSYEAEKLGNDKPRAMTDKVYYLDRFTSHRLKVVTLDTEREKNGALTVWAVFYNDDNEEFWADVQFIFLDGKGHEVETTNFMPNQFIQAKKTTIKMTSLRTDAEDYQIVVRSPKQNP